MRRLVFIAHSCQNLSNPFIYKASGIYIKGVTKRHLVLAPITLRKLPEWTGTPIARRAVVYTGDFENTAGDIWLLNYKHLSQLWLYRRKRSV